MQRNFGDNLNMSTTRLLIYCPCNKFRSFMICLIYNFIRMKISTKIITQVWLIFLIISVATCKKSSTKVESEGPLIHEYIKLSVWLMLGVVIGVFFEAKMQLKWMLKPIWEKGLNGLLIAVVIYGLFMFASFVSRYL